MYQCNYIHTHTYIHAFVLSDDPKSEGFPLPNDDVQTDANKKLYEDMRKADHAAAEEKEKQRLAFLEAERQSIEAERRKMRRALKQRQA